MAAAPDEQAPALVTMVDLPAVFAGRKADTTAVTAEGDERECAGELLRNGAPDAKPCRSRRPLPAVEQNANRGEVLLDGRPCCESLSQY